MSKKRPSIKAADLVPARATADYWQARVFQNTFTRGGRRFRVRNWSVKIQHEGRRRTFSLAAADRAAAAAEACELYRILRTYGWNHVTGPSSALAEHLQRLTSARDETAKRSAAYWKPRLVARKYTEALGAGTARTLSIRIEHEGTDDHFPLVTTDLDEAALKALEIYQTIVQRGWAQARLTFARELTVGIFWSGNPFATTYTTLFTVPANQPGPPEASGHGEKARAPILLLEPDPGLRRALRRWLGEHATLFAPDVSDPDIAGRCARRRPLLALINSQLGRNEDVLSRLLGSLSEGLPSFPYGVFENSDQIFASLSGVTGGYILRRRPPGGLLDPISRALAHPATFQTELPAQIKRYFQSLFETPSASREERLVSLTEREQEILDYLSKGFLDKEIADNLGISAWTVHSHVKRIFEKFQVHTRTEAVVKYLQK